MTSSCKGFVRYASDLRSQRPDRKAQRHDSEGFTLTNLWSANTPARFWSCLPDPPEDQWNAAFQKALPTLELPVQPDTIDSMLNTVLGEGQFGPDHWQLSAAKRFYYILKPAIPRTII